MNSFSGPDPALAPVGEPALLLVLTSPDCSSSQQLLEQVRQLEHHCPSVLVEQCHGPDAEQVQRRHGISKLPAVLIDNDLVVKAPVSAHRLAQLLSLRKTPAYDTERLCAFLEQSRLEKVVEYLHSGRDPKAIVPLLLHGSLAIRIGAILVLQRAHEQKPGCVSAIIPDLIELLETKDVSLRGEIADLLGLVGDERAIAPLRNLLRDEDEEVVEAAADSLDLLGAFGSPFGM